MAELAWYYALPSVSVKVKVCARPVAPAHLTLPAPLTDPLPSADWPRDIPAGCPLTLMSSPLLLPPPLTLAPPPPGLLLSSDAEERDGIPGGLPQQIRERDRGAEPSCAGRGGRGIATQP